MIELPRLKKHLNGNYIDGLRFMKYIVFFLS